MNQPQPEMEPEIENEYDKAAEQYLPYWAYGDQRRLAKLAGMMPQNLSQVLHRKRGVRREMAMKLAKLCADHFGLDISAKVWLTNKYTKHPAFFGDPIL